MNDYCHASLRDNCDAINVPPPWYMHKQPRRYVTVKIEGSIYEWDEYLHKRVVDAIKAALSR